MSLQIRVPEVVGEWLAVPQTQRNNFMHFSRLLNPRSLGSYHGINHPIESITMNPTDIAAKLTFTPIIL
jgi:hypothetical protein